MTEEVKGAPEQEAPAAEPTQTIKLEDIKSLQQLRELQQTTERGLLEWARKRIQETNYVQAVQTELAMHKGDAHGFLIAALINMVENQDKRIDALENLFLKAAKITKEKK